MRSTITQGTPPNYSFAYSDGALVTPVTTGPNANVMNFTDGMVSKTEYEEQQPDQESEETVVVNVGKKVLVGDFNILGRIGCNAGLFRSMGGVRTFNPDFSTLIGGYPKGAQLYHHFVSGGQHYLRKVVSMVDNNTFNFLTESAGVDNVHWAYCDTFNPFLSPKSNLSGVVNILHGIMDYNSKKDWSISNTVTLAKDCRVFCCPGYHMDGYEHGDFAPTSSYLKVGDKYFYQQGKAGNLTSNDGKIVRAGSVLTAYAAKSSGKHMAISIVGIPTSLPIGRI